MTPRQSALGFDPCRVDWKGSKHLCRITSPSRLLSNAWDVLLLLSYLCTNSRQRTRVDPPNRSRRESRCRPHALSHHFARNKNNTRKP